MSSRYDRRLWELAGMFLLIAWFCLLNGWQSTAIILFAAIIHEMGHWIVLRLLGGRLLRLRLSSFGAVMETEELRLSYPGELLAILAGPGANFLLGSILACVPSELCLAAAGANWTLGMFNLLPAAPLDGWRALQQLLYWAAGPERGARWTTGIGLAGALLLCGGILWLMTASGGNIWLLPAALGIGLNGCRACISGKQG